MLRNEFSLFLGKKSEHIFSGFIAEGGLFMIVEIAEGATRETGDHFLKLVKDKVKDAPIQDLSHLETIITQALHQANLPISVSISACLIKGTTAFLKTLGDGEIYLHRKKEFAKIISGSSDAVGSIEEQDLYALSTTSFSALFSQNQLKKIILSSDVFTVVDSIYEEINDKQDEGVIALFVSPLSGETLEDKVLVDSEGTTSLQAQPNSENSGKKHKFPLKMPSLSFLAGLNGLQSPDKKKKVITMGIVLVLLGILIWSVGLGYQRRIEAEREKKIETTRHSIITKLNEAESSAEDNLDKSLELIASAKTDLNTLKDEVGTKNPEAVTNLQKIITDKESQITKSEDKVYEEFYDLSVDSKGAKAVQFVTTGTNGALLDKSSGKVYLLSLSNKSIDNRAVSEMKDATLIALYEDTVYLFLPSKGIYTVSKDGKAKKIIDADSEWGSIKDMKIYGGNIYLLDSSKKDLYKYLVAENGYSNRQSYFKGDFNVDGAESFAIDSSVYVGRADDVDKYNGGVQTSFNTSYPEASISIKKVITDADLDSVYVWDSVKGVIYVLAKSGEYDRQVQSSILKKADDVVVVENTIYLLSGSKIYKITL